MSGSGSGGVDARWYMFLGGALLGGGLAAGALYSYTRYLDSLSDEPDVRRHARRKAARSGARRSSSSEVRFAALPVLHEVPTDGEADVSEVSDGAMVNGHAHQHMGGVYAGPADRSNYSAMETIRQSSLTAPTGATASHAATSAPRTIAMAHASGNALAASPSGGTLKYMVASVPEHPPLPLAVPQIHAQAVQTPPPAHVIHNTSDMMTEGQIIEDAALHEQYCRVITPEPALNEEQEDVAAQLRDFFELRFKWVFQPELGPEDMAGEEVPVPSALNPGRDPFEWQPCERAAVRCENIDGVYCVFDEVSGDELYPLPGTATNFFTDMHRMLKMVSGGSVRSFCHHRLVLLEQKFNLHVMLNADKEFLAQKTAPHRDFYNVRKVDTHVHHSACMHQKHLLRFIKSKLRKEPDEVVIFRDGKYLTLREVFASLGITAYDLNVDRLDMHADKNIFHRFDKFNLKYNPCGQSRLREIFIKQDNLIHGRFLAEVTKEVFTDLEASKYQHAEYRVSIYGRKCVEWDILAAWAVNNRLYSDNVVWLIQIPRLYNVYKQQGIVEHFGQLLDNIFQPLFEVTADPNSHPQLDVFLRMVVGFDIVDDESKPERRPVKHMPTPSEWNVKHNPAYAYYSYYIYANLYTLNKFRQARGLSTFAFRPHCGEAGDVDHLVSSFMLSHNISHGIQLRKCPALQYMYYLAQIGLCMSPLSNNSLFLDYHRNPFPLFFARGLSCSLSTDDPLQIHLTKEPLVEEYSVAAQVWKLSATDLSEIARNSVLHSGYPHQVKMHWVHTEYWKPGPEGNDIHKTNVPNLRMRFRYDCHSEEMNLVFSGAYAHDLRVKAAAERKEVGL